MSAIAGLPARAGGHARGSTAFVIAVMLAHR